MTLSVSCTIRIKKKCQMMWNCVELWRWSWNHSFHVSYLNLISGNQFHVLHLVETKKSDYFLLLSHSTFKAIKCKLLSGTRSFMISVCFTEYTQEGWWTFGKSTETTLLFHIITTFRIFYVNHFKLLASRDYIQLKSGQFSLFCLVNARENGKSQRNKLIN